MNQKSNMRILMSFKNFYLTGNMYSAFMKKSLEEEYGLERVEKGYHLGARFLVKNEKKFLFKVIQENIKYEKFV